MRDELNAEISLTFEPRPVSTHDCQGLLSPRAAWRYGSRDFVSGTMEWSPIDWTRETGRLLYEMARGGFSLNLRDLDTYSHFNFNYSIVAAYCDWKRITTGFEGIRYKDENPNASTTP